VHTQSGSDSIYWRRWVTYQPGVLPTAMLPMQWSSFFEEIHLKQWGHSLKPKLGIDSLINNICPHPCDGSYWDSHRSQGFVGWPWGYGVRVQCAWMGWALRPFTFESSYPCVHPRVHHISSWSRVCRSIFITHE